MKDKIKKVKKWKWLISVHGRAIIVEYMTDEEMKRYVLAHGNIAYYQKINQSEKEFPMEEV